MIRNVLQTIICWNFERKFQWKIHQLIFHHQKMHSKKTPYPTKYIQHQIKKEEKRKKMKEKERKHQTQSIWILFSSLQSFVLFCDTHPFLL